MIVIVGAGLAGLACARTLLRAGVDPARVRLVDRAGQPGGRVATARRDGYVIDRGFQVLLSSYPTARRLLDFDALELCWFDSGALLSTGRREIVPWYSPTRHPLRGVMSALAGPLRWSDQLRLARLMGGLLVAGEKAAQDRFAALETAELFRLNGLKDNVLETFLRPFYGGVLLDDKLSTSAALWALYARRFLFGRAGVPRLGMAEIPRQLAAGLDPQVWHGGREVAAIEPGDGGPVVRFQGGGSWSVGQVVLATDPWTAAHWLGVDAPAARATTAVYFSSASPVYRQRLLALFPGPGRWVRHAVQLSNVNPAAAPEGRHLFCATVLKAAEGMADEEVYELTMNELREFLPNGAEGLEPLAIERVPRALPAQGVDWLDRRRRWAEACPPGVVLAGDAALHASIEGALGSGVAAAEQVMKAEGRVVAG